MHNLNKYPESYDVPISGIRTMEVVDNKPLEKLAESIVQNNPKDFKVIDQVFHDEEVAEIQEEDGLPHPQTTFTHTKPQVVVADLIEESVANIKVTRGKEKEPTCEESTPKVKFPERGTEPASEFQRQLLTKMFPHGTMWPV